MKIPKKFKLFGQTIKVEIVNIINDDNYILGSTIYDKNKILLKKTNSKQQMETTFYHELTHLILYYTGEDEFSPSLHMREFFVDRLSLLIHQFLTTAN